MVEKTGVLEYSLKSKATRDLPDQQGLLDEPASRWAWTTMTQRTTRATEDEALRYALYSAGLNSVIEIGGGIQKIPEKTQL